MRTRKNPNWVFRNHYQNAEITRMTLPHLNTMWTKTAFQIGKKQPRVPKSKLSSGMDKDAQWSLHPSSTGPLKTQVPSQTETMKVKGGFNLTLKFERLFSSSPSSFSLSKGMFQARCKIWASLLPHPEPPSLPSPTLQR